MRQQNATPLAPQFFLSSSSVNPLRWIGAGTSLKGLADEANQCAGREAGRAEGHEKGRKAGHEAGRAEGYEAGQKAGYEAGRAEGYEAGRKAARDETAPPPEPPPSTEL